MSQLPPRLLHVTTVPMSLMFMRGQVGYVKRCGYVVHAVSSPGPELEAFGEEEDVAVHAVEMPRRITPVGDLVALWRLWRLFRRIRPDIVHAHTPKGGLLGTLAAWLARVPNRVYHMRGLPMMAATGWKRKLLAMSEKTTCRLAHRVMCVSGSLRQVAIDERLCPPGKIKVLAGGSGNGVDATGRFSPERHEADTRDAVRAAHGIPAGAVVAGFVGRVVRDKGVGELAEAWRSLREQYPALHLMLAGPVEPQDPLSEHVIQQLRDDDRVHLLGHVDDTAPLYTAMDLVVLPTYREGLPNVPLEAAAMERAVVATRIPGCVDAVADGETGTLVPAKDAEALAGAIANYLDDPKRRARHGKAGRQRVLEQFRQEVIWEALAQEYASLLGRSLVVPDAPEPQPAGTARS